MQVNKNYYYSYPRTRSLMSTKIIDKVTDTVFVVDVAWLFRQEKSSLKSSNDCNYLKDRFEIVRRSDKN